MKKRIFLSIVCILLFCFTTVSQQAHWSGTNIISPEINSDNSVGFRYLAPDARDVVISGDFFPAEGWTPVMKLSVRMIFCLRKFRTSG